MVTIITYTSKVCILLQIMLPLKTALSPIELSVLGHRITATDIGSENYTLLDRNIAWVAF